MRAWSWEGKVIYSTEFYQLQTGKTGIGITNGDHSALKKAKALFKIIITFPLLKFP